MAAPVESGWHSDGAEIGVGGGIDAHVTRLSRVQEACPGGVCVFV